MRKQKGFSLIELLIVVAIILIIAAIAIPNLLRARIAANESSAVASERTITTAEVTYTTAYPTIGYAANLLSLGGALGGACTPTSTSACLIDSVLANAGTGSAGKSGYLFGANASIKSGSVNTGYVTGASPVTKDTTGIRSFCAIEDGVVRVDPAGGTDSTFTADSSCDVLNPLNQ